ncbi:MAG: ZIP family metal transporter [Nanoarchaeota archaeon]
MNSVWLYSLISVFLVSLVSFIGAFTLAIKKKKLQKILIYLISFSAGALFGDAFIHILPEVVKKNGFGLDISFSLLFGIFLFFILEKIVHYQHYHCEGNHCDIKPRKIHSFAYVNLFGGGLHNFIDGIIIAVSYLANIQIGIATTLAVILHEIPHELGDFGILVHGGFTRAKALLVNFLSALIAVVGTILALWLNNAAEQIASFLLPLAAGGFIYIAGSDLIPELHKEAGKGALLQTIFFILGIAIMAILLILG